MRVYLAAPYQAREQIKAHAADLVARDFTVTSSWLKEQHEIHAGTTGAAQDLPDSQVAQHATDDLRDIDGSDVLVLFTESSVGHLGGGGRHVETGYAICKGLPVVVVGEPENVFHRLPRVATVVPDWPAAVRELTGYIEAAS